MVPTKRSDDDIVVDDTDADADDGVVCSYHIPLNSLESPPNCPDLEHSTVSVRFAGTARLIVTTTTTWTTRPDIKCYPDYDFSVRLTVADRPT